MFVTILSKSFFTFVSGHFMSLSLLSAWHNYKFLDIFNKKLLANLLNKSLRWLKCRD